MAVDLCNEYPIDESAPKHEGWLSKLQGNILRSHGRDHTALLLMHFESEAEARHVLGALSGYATSALDQRVEADRYKQRETGDTLFGSVSISAKGYEILGFKDLHAFAEDDEPDAPVSNFREGMKAHAVADFHDPEPSTWEPRYRGDLHAVLLLAHDDLVKLADNVHQARARIGASLVGEPEYGHVIRNAARQPLEHFGFADGVSQPLYLASEVVRSGNAYGDPRTNLRINNHSMFKPLRDVLRVDPFGGGEDCFGSMLVLRKIEQDVHRFARQEYQLADALGLRGRDRERAAALLAGRFRDGSPLAITPVSGLRPPGENDFSYREDRGGLRCPLQSHSRRANLRGTTYAGENYPEMTKDRPLTRRGVTYGEPVALTGCDASLNGIPERGLGLLFMAYQASIRRQFAYIQKHWLNAPAYPVGASGPCPLAGQGPVFKKYPPMWPASYNNRAGTPFVFESCVTMRGGEYFFTPSVPFLQKLAQPPVMT
jgi:deferrochelatase/peroxidase EfeB